MQRELFVDSKTVGVAPPSEYPRAILICVVKQLQLHHALRASYCDVYSIFT